MATDQLARVQIEVQSLAKPTPEILLAARNAIRNAPELQELFTQAKAEGWGADRLADSLNTRLREHLIDGDNAWDAAQYLADEFLQVGDSILLISKETGRAVAQLSEEDIYVPDLVSRETGNLRRPLPRIRPDLEGLIVEWQFARSKEKQVVQALAARVHQTELLRQEGDHRLLRATRAGREQIVTQLQEELPSLLGSATGVTRDFLNMFDFCTEAPSGAPIVSGGIRSFAKVIMTIADPLSVNLRHDPYTTLRGQLTSQWARDIARAVADLAHAHGLVTNGSIFDTLPPGFWVADPNTAMALRPLIALAVSGAKTALLQRVSELSLVIEPTSYLCKGREFLDRWEVAAEFHFSICVMGGSQNLLGYNFTDVPTTGLSVEVV